VQAQELLTNSDLDLISVSSQVLATPNNWDVVANRAITGAFNDGASSEPWAGPAPTPVTTNGFNNPPPFNANGDYGLFFKPFTGNTANGDVTVTFTQLVAGTPGLPYTLKGWAGAEPNYIGLTDPTVGSLFRIEFLDAAANPISSVSLDLVANMLGVPNGQPFSYRQFSLTGVAPAGTVFVRAGAAMIDAYANPAGGGQAFVVDDFSLTVPEPASLGLLCVSGLTLLARRRSA
jgi:hypothetical protein